MKTTMTMHKIANPRRTTLAHLKDADELTTRVVAAEAEEAEAADAASRERLAAFPTRTANPRRTTLQDAPPA